MIRQPGEFLGCSSAAPAVGSGVKLLDAIITSAAIFLVSVAGIFVCVGEFEHPLTP
ncbi:MAG: hypothetical protein ABIZ80_15825 [Bryobacteraceae bacterium]